MKKNLKNIMKILNDDDKYYMLKKRFFINFCRYYKNS